jgi:hypothetical protein
LRARKRQCPIDAGVIGSCEPCDDILAIRARKQNRILVDDSDPRA